MKLIECVPNFSEGRDISIVNAIRDRIAAGDVCRGVFIDWLGCDGGNGLVDANPGRAAGGVDSRGSVGGPGHRPRAITKSVSKKSIRKKSNAA